MDRNMSDQTSQEPPSYATATGLSRSHDITTPYQTTTHILQTKVTTTRTTHIQSIIDNHILPIIQHRASRGLSRTSIALLPLHITPTAPISSDQESNNPPPAKIIDIVAGNANDDDLQHIQLLESLDIAAFWSQYAVLVEFRRVLRERLEAEHVTVAGDKKSNASAVAAAPQNLAAVTPSAQKQQSRTRGFFSRKSSSKVQGLDVGQLSPATGTVTTPALVVDVQPEEFCLRMLNEFGLYETLTRPGLIVRVKIVD